MTATAHALVGAAIVSVVPEPVIGLSLAFTSHILLDMIPHWDEGRGWRKKTKLQLLGQGTFDLSLGFVLSYLVFGIHLNFYYFLASFIAALFLDLAQVPYWILNWRFPPFSWIYKFQHNIQGKAAPLFGIFTQVATVGLVILAVRIIR